MPKEHATSTDSAFQSEAPNPGPRLLKLLLIDWSMGKIPQRHEVGRVRVLNSHICSQEGCFPTHSVHPATHIALGSGYGSQCYRESTALSCTQCWTRWAISKIGKSEGFQWLPLGNPFPSLCLQQRGNIPWTKAVVSAQWRQWWGEEHSWKGGCPTYQKRS